MTVEGGVDGITVDGVDGMIVVGGEGMMVVGADGRLVPGVDGITVPAAGGQMVAPGAQLPGMAFGGAAMVGWPIAAPGCGW
jgi:hypothetical protein